MRVSRLFFSSAAPLIWKNIYRASDLLLLISGAQLISIVRDSVEIIELPHSLKRSHFARFNIYAPFVKTLVIDHEPKLSPYPMHHKERPIRLDSIIDWQVLSDYLAGEALLPNLESISFRYPDYQACLNWLRVLLLPSVHRIEAIVVEPEWPVEVICTMLRLAASKSADVDHLFISPRGFDTDSIEDDADPDSLSERQLEFSASFAPFHKLSYLRSNIAVLYPQSILVLSELPCLEELMVGVEAAPDLLCYDISLPETAFPSFRELILENVMNPRWILDLWSVQALFKNLETISITMWPGIYEPEHQNQWADDFISRLCSHSPKLSDLVILFNSGGDNSLAPFRLSRGAQELFRLLPLKSLMICDAYFEDGCAFLSSAWPGIVALGCDQRASLADLVDFAQNLPHLEKLQLNVELGGSIPEFDPLLPLSPRHTAFKRLCFDPPRPFKHSSSQTKKLAEFLYLLWPNIQCSRSFWDIGGADMLDAVFMNHDGERGFHELKALDSRIRKLRLKGHQ
ncbi:hypothetical protein FRC08_013407 [Ceratobasidium sp. 394]|nr:hypothetical protein FRC08_013407 [Ceratobasidium sp. 394]